MSREELLASLLAERYGTGEWFTGKSRDKPNPDDELTTARRRRELLDDTPQRHAN